MTGETGRMFCGWNYATMCEYGAVSPLNASSRYDCITPVGVCDFSVNPTLSPISFTPSLTPSNNPSMTPSSFPSGEPTISPSIQPTIQPSTPPSSNPKFLLQH